VKDTNGETRTEQVHASFPTDQGDDWLWMVAADPAFYLEDYEG
jgi:hypothetical protein